jgi:methylated-DNA-[protein]-cysteine S-methyltransferase
VRLIRTAIATPLGDLLALASETGLCALEFQRLERTRRLERRLGRWFSSAPCEDGTCETLDCVREWLDGYFSGSSADATRLPLDLRGSSFERRVWAALLEIPPGETATYGMIARRLGTPGSARAVGLANGANPVAIIVPCHRIIGSDGTLTGYGGGLERKEWLLRHEARFFRPLRLTAESHQPFAGS